MTMENTNREKGEEEIARGIVGKWGYEEKYWWGPIAQTLKDAREEAYQAGLRRAREAIRNMPKVNRGTIQYEEKYVRWNSFGKDIGVDDLLTALSEEIKSMG